MQSDELLQFGFESKKVYPPEKQYNLMADEAFGSFLHLHYPEVEDMLVSVREEKMKLRHYDQGIAAIGVFPTLTLWLNFNRLTAMKEKCGLLEMYDFYEMLACLLLHEKSHCSLQHFRIPFPAYNHTLMNIAQDMVIDTRIHRKNPQWRNWQEMIDKINQKIDEKGVPFPKISTAPKDRYYVLHFSDLDVYNYLVNLQVDLSQTPPRFDEHKWGNEQSEDSSHQTSGEKGQGAQSGQNSGAGTPPPPPDGTGENKPDGQPNRQDGRSEQGEQGGENAQDGQSPDNEQNPQEGQGGQGAQNGQSQPNEQEIQGEQNRQAKQGEQNEQNGPQAENRSEAELPKGFDDLIDEWCSKSRARLAQNDNRLLPQGANTMDEMMHVIARGKEHNLFNLLQKFIKKISYKQTRYTWKKISKKQPYRKPGVMYKKNPGEVLLIIDTSGSMHAFINKHIAEMANAIYTAFARMSRVYGVPSLMYKADVDERVLNLKEIEKVDELKEIDLTGGGGNDFEHIFDKLVLHWKEQTKSAQKFPDFILVLTDFGDDWSFLDRPAYKEVAEKIIWLSTDPYYPLRPSKGYIVDVLSDDWSVSIR